MPTLPVSKKQLDRLGDRLRDASTPSAGDSELLEAVLGAYDEALQAVRGRLRQLGFDPTVRLKTTGTIIDKLRRDRSSSLKTIHDLAGARIVLSGTLRDQDAAVRAVVTAFTDGTAVPSVIDRRADPRSGYRAVHVILRIDGLPVEVQFRTELQDLWAQLFERLADVWGRQIRYGGPPDDVGLSSRTAEARRTIVELLLSSSKAMGEHEGRSARFVDLGIPALLRNAGVDVSTRNEDVPAEVREVHFTYLHYVRSEALAEEALRNMLTKVAEAVEGEVIDG
ncbi:RelA/SpoT domain-containing protein [Pseudosporangium ferrugineum]|uniref:PpGpp synthetase/RelA/SpoT-type nucleotidyltransferase n=1 Tax=Pseudosporangium ferrugineum TaxID=439699 RepID=A0A2T0S3T1_9ACTN|nr:RelA/SpoT domain-containing protein [Pseudosporangium ferrugineum]PRY28085.1 ppGpp synthetase/RelA/SpoT-type nucleotidyltransferase [Pseudosporangium ferrugineum]